MADESEHRVLARWRRNVGAPVALDLAPRAPRGIRGFDLLSWNLKVGAARLDALLERLRAGAFGGAGRDPGRPLLLLVQEAYRADDTVPERVVEPGHEGGDLAPSHPRDIVAFAREHGLSLRYAPSMRNGAARSDRGNAVLATAALAHAHAFALLYVRQRRVAVAAELAGLPGLTLVSAHLDTHRRVFGGDSRSYWPGGARARQAERLAEAVVREDAPGGVVLAGDFNTPLGERDPAYRALLQAGLLPARRRWGWGHTHHAVVRLLLDHVLYHPGRGRIGSVEVARLDEHPADRDRGVFGSDHHPLLARVGLRDP
ncbi:MAG TPA: endonuclease/exonuclease/phosphatase family protein [Longimicrobiaceae bacterium]|nr:endonuclease/exonuclease/phosphatase family protein [Longimicrobiaceae bacterium]